MATQDTCCTIVPYFKVREGQLDNFKAKCEEFVKLTDTEKKCLYYGFSFDGNLAHCREGYKDAEGLLAHLDNVGALLPKHLRSLSLSGLKYMARNKKLAKLRAPLVDLNPQYFVLEYGFRR